ncbi:hypothetical protein BKH46_07405 [Helicobacter sp. 12S02634-8]|uniref:hypothetical protein n=1 Tax=Helicobacter sp. 12S02634-8 TaxID=1476199 RepID=UPI000BA6C856|nr:hypothetical protein [Helicobacter sp. 12S02634-8]PAF46560.1 hypothetical protein BKH46_07405 [Helicobacter sp. 12S02634-8]
MGINFEKQMVIHITQSLVMRYGPIMELDEFGEFFKFGEKTIQNKIQRGDTDIPKYTQLKGKRVFLANDIAEWMVCNELRFPK